MSVSFALVAAGPAWRAQRLLALVRAHVDEIVLAGDAELVESCGELADRVVTARPGEACRGDWVVCCADDEIPSRALLEALRELAAERRLARCALTHRCLWPDRARYLLSPPWQPGYRPRIARRGAGPVGEQRLLDLPIYRAELLLASEASRRVRALNAERGRPEASRGGAPDGAELVPEDWDGLVLEDVPGADRAAVAYVLDAGASPPGGEARGREPSVPVVAGDAAIAFVRPVTRTRTNVAHEQEVEVRNHGEGPWPWRAGARAPIRLGHRWRAAGGGAVVGEGPRTLFGETVEPGTRSRACMTVEAPAQAGRYVLEVDVVEEHVRWFGWAARLEVTVEDHGAGGAPSGRRGYVAQARTHGLAAAQAVRLYRRWTAGRAATATPLADGRPWLTFAAQDALARALRPGSRLCEYGSGGSTRFALERGAEVVTIEWDADWAARVADATAEHGARWTLAVVPAEADASAPALDPSDPGAYVSASPAFANFSFRAYARAIDRFGAGAFDVVLVAGRARPSCVRHALGKVAPGGLLVLDHAERPWYGPALALADGSSWTRTDHAGPGPYAERFWQTTILRRTA